MNTMNTLNTIFEKEFKKKKKDDLKEIPKEKQEKNQLSSKKLNDLQEVQRDQDDLFEISSDQKINYKSFTQIKLFLNCKKINELEIFDTNYIMDLKRSKRDLFKSIFFKVLEKNGDDKKIIFNDYLFYNESTLILFYPNINIINFLLKIKNFNEEMEERNIKFFKFLNYDKVFPLNFNESIKIFEQEKQCLYCPFFKFEKNNCSLK